MGNTNQNGDGRNANPQARYQDRAAIPPAGRPNERNNQGSSEDGQTQKVIVLKNHVNIKKESIKIVKNSETLHHLEFKFDANYECVITVYICAQECRNASNIPLFFYTNPAHPSPNAYKFSPGLKQQFPSQVCMINTSLYKLEDLTQVKDDYYPIVISIEAIYPQNYTGRAKKSIQFTYGQFVQESPGNLKFRYLKQKFLVNYIFIYNLKQYNNTIFDLNDIYGIDNNTANITDETQRECVICYTTTKDTVVLPCRHMCLCIQCSQIVRMQTNKCPICRTQVSSFMQIKIEDKPTHHESGTAVRN